MEKFYPEIGTPLFLYQRTGNYYVDQVKRPYTVVGTNNGKVQIQSCKYIWPVYHCTGNPYLDRKDLEGKRVAFFDTIPEKIEPDLNGEIIELCWAPKKECWQVDKYKTGYPEYAKFGEYQYFPYLN